MIPGLPLQTQGIMYELFAHDKDRFFLAGSQFISVIGVCKQAIRKVDSATGQTKTIVGSLPGFGQGTAGLQDGHATVSAPQS